MTLIVCVVDRRTAVSAPERAGVVNFYGDSFPSGQIGLFPFSVAPEAC